MQLSTDLPCGPKAIKEYLAAREAGAPPMKANVTIDEATLTAMQRSFQQRTCCGCGRKFIVSRKQENRVFHSDACHAKATEKYMALGVIPNGWKPCAACGGAFCPERSNEKYCKRRACSRASARLSARTASEQAA
jgi:hypothetical protein